MRILPVLGFALCSASALAAPHELALPSATLGQLDSLAVDASLVIDHFPDGHGGSRRVRLTRIDVYAPGARILAVDGNGERELPRSARIELVGGDDDGQMRVHLAFDRGFRNVVGSGSTPTGTFAVGARSDGGDSRLVVRSTEETLPAGVTPRILDGDDSAPNPFAPPAPLLTLGLDAVTATPRGAVVAVDVDHELLVNRFGGTAQANLTAATNWVADLFATMNVMYVRDLNVSLQQGTTILRTGATPYTIAANASASQADLDNFGSYWQSHHADVPRAFVALLSGQMTGGFSASGRAWINSYCRKPSYGGSYSVNKVFTSAQVGVDLSTRIVGHELGHNFGAAHTHCTNATSGAYAASSGTIDTCFSGETMTINGVTNACYSGAVSCPASGPGAPKGSIMSYCNIPTQAGGPNCGQNVLQFHPTQIATLSALIAQNTPTCLTATIDQIFKNGFD